MTHDATSIGRTALLAMTCLALAGALGACRGGPKEPTPNPKLFATSPPLRPAERSRAADDVTTLLALGVPPFRADQPVKQLGGKPVVRDASGKITKIGDVAVTYASDGKVAQIADAKVGYAADGKPNTVDTREVGYNGAGQITTFGTAPIDYDGNGKAVWIGGAAVEYDEQGRVTRIGGVEVTY